MGNEKDILTVGFEGEPQEVVDDRPAGMAYAVTDDGIAPIGYVDPPDPKKRLLTQADVDCDYITARFEKLVDGAWGIRLQAKGEIARGTIVPTVRQDGQVPLMIVESLVNRTGNEWVYKASAKKG